MVLAWGTEGNDEVLQVRDREARGTAAGRGLLRWEDTLEEAQMGAALDEPTASPAAIPTPATVPAMPRDIAVDSGQVPGVRAALPGSSQPTPLAQPLQATGETVDAAITFYSCPPYCATTASGESLYEGGAACGYSLPLGATFQIEGEPTGRTFTCNDRGLGPYWWVDIFFWDAAEGWAWLAQVGSRGTIVVLEMMR